MKEGDRAIILKIKGTAQLRSYLLTLGLVKGAVFTKNYSPSYTKLINITINGKMLGLKRNDFQNIEYELF
ncbi:MAG: ferrous iron transport protein A [Saprospiraceae bacterium]|nr:ferrous iron transport protein A [Saprospiraceae bacterium]